MQKVFQPDLFDVEASMEENREYLQMKEQAARQLGLMLSKARGDGVLIKVLSGYRSPEYQEKLRCQVKMQKRFIKSHQQVLHGLNMINCILEKQVIFKEHITIIEVI